MVDDPHTDPAPAVDPTRRTGDGAPLGGDAAETRHSAAPRRGGQASTRVHAGVLSAVAVSVAALAVVLAVSAPQRPERTPDTTTTLPALPGMGVTTALDPAAQDPAPVALEALAATAMARGVVSAFLLPCQRPHSVELTPVGGTLAVELRAGLAPGTESCTGDPRLVAVAFDIPVPLQGRPLVPSAG